jgi:thiol:disulfide interchange protein
MGIELNSNGSTQVVSTLQFVEPVEVHRRMAAGDTFVVNVVAAWCPDCTERQKPYIEGFGQAMKRHGVDVLQVTVQLQKGDFISAEHEQMTAQFGGPGYPRTVLIRHGNLVDYNNVEVITEGALSALATKFMQIITTS